MMQQPTQTNEPSPEAVFKEAHHLLWMGDVFEASKRAGKLRHHFPDGVPFLALHGFVLAKMGVHPQALADLIRAAQMTEESLKAEGGEEHAARPRAVDQLIRLSVQICLSSLAIGELGAAAEAIGSAEEWGAGRGDVLGAKAELLFAQGNEDQAIELIAQGLEEKAQFAAFLLSKSRVLLGSESASKEAFEALAEELDQQSQASGMGAMDLGDLLRALGMVHDRLGRYDDAFGAFRRAANFRRGSHDPRAYTMMTTKVIHDWSSEHIAKLKRPDQSGDRLVLVLGAPHSGGEQLAQMLGQFDDVAVVGPVESLSMTCIQHLNARQGVLRPVPFEPAKLRGVQLNEAAMTYGVQIGMIAGESASRCIDTHPLNIPLAGAASAFLPGVNIVVCRRDPMESTLATYCDAMIGNHAYAGELLGVAGFVADSNRMLDHWVSTLGDEAVGANVVSVEYADLASDPKKAAAKVAREIGLDARATSIKQVPAFDRGPGTHPDVYSSYTKAIEGFFDPASA